MELSYIRWPGADAGPPGPRRQTRVPSVRFPTQVEGHRSQGKGWRVAEPKKAARRRLTRFRGFRISQRIWNDQTDQSQGWRLQMTSPKFVSQHLSRSDAGRPQFATRKSDLEQKSTIQVGPRARALSRACDAESSSPRSRAMGTAVCLVLPSFACLGNYSIHPIRPHNLGWRQESGWNWRDAGSGNLNISGQAARSIG